MLGNNYANTYNPNIWKKCDECYEKAHNHNQHFDECFELCVHGEPKHCIDCDNEEIPIMTIKLSLDRYVEDRIATGGFLHAVLTNDLFGAMERADEFNRDDLYNIVKYIFNHIPGECYGSKAKVSKWLKGAK